MNVAGVVVGVMLMAVTFVGVVDVPGLVAVMLVGVALVDVVVVKLGVVFVTVTFVGIVDVAGLVAVMLVGVAFVDIVHLPFVTSAEHFRFLIVLVPFALPTRFFAKHYPTIETLPKINLSRLKSQFRRVVTFGRLSRIETGS